MKAVKELRCAIKIAEAMNVGWTMICDSKLVLSFYNSALLEQIELHMHRRKAWYARFMNRAGEEQL